MRPGNVYAQQDSFVNVVMNELENTVENMSCVFTNSNRPKKLHCGCKCKGSHVMSIIYRLHLSNSFADLFIFNIP